MSAKVRPNGHFFICSLLMFSGCRAVRPNGYFLFIVQLGPAEWSSPFSTVKCLMFSGSRVISRMAISFSVQCLRFGGCRAEMVEWPSFLVFNVDAESV